MEAFVYLAPCFGIGCFDPFFEKGSIVVGFRPLLDFDHVFEIRTRFVLKGIFLIRTDKARHVCWLKV